MNLHVFSNGVDYVIAESEKEAHELLPYVPDLGMEMKQQPNDVIFGVWYDEQERVVLAHHEGELVNHTNQEWIDLIGKGYFATTEF